MSINDSPEKRRLDAAFNLEPVDRPPALGGWIADPAKIIALAGCTEDEYWGHPVERSIEAYHALRLDGLLDVNVPSERGGYTLVTENDLHARAAHTPESMADEIETLPAPEEVVESFDEEEAYRKKRLDLDRMQALCGDRMYWCPARWEVIPSFEWYRVYGYETYLMAMYMHPDHIHRLFAHSAAQAECNARVVARMLRDGIQPKAMLCGQDICGQSGPLVDPGFLREHYFPLVKRAVQPLLEAGAKLIWHCDGDIRPILDDILDLGVGGLQGFQEECGVHLRDIVERRTIDDEKLIVLGPVSVTKTLVKETPEGVRRAVSDAIAICEGKASLVLFTSNEILPDVPLANMMAMYEALHALAV